MKLNAHLRRRLSAKQLFREASTFDLAVNIDAMATSLMAIVGLVAALAGTVIAFQPATARLPSSGGSGRGRARTRSRAR